MQYLLRLGLTSDPKDAGTYRNGQRPPRPDGTAPLTIVP